MKITLRFWIALAGCMVALALIPAQTAHAAPSPDRAKVQKLLERMASGEKSFSASELTLIEKEFDATTTTVAEVVTMEPMAFSGCWSRGVEATVRGGITQAKMFTVGQTTKVCVTSGKVSSVSVPNKYLLLHGYIGVSSKGVTSSTHDVDWEGRGLAIGTVALGAGGWDISSKSQCVQMRLNADGVHYQGSTSCSI